MPITSLNFRHLALHNAADIYEMFRLLGYDVDEPYAYEGDEVDQFEFDEPDAQSVQRVYIVGKRDRHQIYLYEVDDLRQPRLRGLAWNALQRGGSALLALTTDYREILFVDPRLAGAANKGNVRVNKLKLIVDEPTRHDLDTLNAIHAHRRTGQEVDQAQAEAFNVTTITKRFYDEYRAYYERVRAAAQRYNKGVREFQDSDKTDRLHAFSQRLLGRLMFIYFLQRKGWLGGRRKFLTDQYRATMQRHLDEFNGDQETFYFYEEVLVPLFFDTMNTKRLGNATRWTGILIPYLNGGLFDPARDPQGPILLPDSLFDPNSNEGVLAFFNRYNFTISEDTPLEQDVAVDPEMLGKVFENMLEERDRGQSGSFYTPRVIVAYMCQEALAGYLEESAGVSRDVVRAQFDPDSEQRFSPDEAARVNTALDTLTVLDPAVGSGSFLIGMMTEIIRLRRACWQTLQPPPQPLPHQEGGASRPTAGVDSPSLLVGEGVGGWGEAVPPSLLADWKEAIIRDTLYGVDIKPEAIEIAQLRLWLSLVVDQTLEQARPLPNLDYKLMAGNSLIETIDGEPVLGQHAETMLDGDFSGAGPAVAPVQQNFLGNAVQTRFDLFDTQKAVQDERVKLDKLRRDFFKATPEERKSLRQQITSQERQIVYASLHEKTDQLMQQIAALGKKAGQNALSKTEKGKLEKLTAKLDHLNALEQQVRNPDKPLPFFLYRMHFHEVFAAKGGFDVVIANPPYVRHEQITAIKPALELAYPNVYAGTADLYVYFYARGLDLARPKGTLVYISPNKFMRAGYGKRMRDYLRQQVTLDTLIDFGDLPLFDATTYPLIAALRKAPPTPDHTLCALNVESMVAVERMAQTAQTAFPLPQSSLTSAEWQLSNPAVRALMDKLRAAGKPLGEYVNGKFYRGITTGLNEAFVIDGAKRAELITADPQSAEIIKPFLRGRDVKRWQVQPQDLYLIFTRRGIKIEDYPAVLAHLSQYKDRLMPGVKGGRKPGDYQWYEIQDTSAYYGEFEKPKIMYPDIAARPQFSFDSHMGFYLGNTAYIIPTDDKYLLGILNSDVFIAFYNGISSQIRGGYYRFIAQYMEQIPIPNAPQPLRDQIAAVARQCLATPDEAKRAPLEARLNQLVYQAYGLNDDDIRVIEGYLSGQGGAAGVESAAGEAEA